MELPKINIVIIGHIDHGKSTLIGRLLYDAGAIKTGRMKELEETTKQLQKDFEFAFVMDSFEEEVLGGLTIDTIQTPFKSKKHLYTIIDCPGHKEFIKNMITGASQADAGILVISAKEGEGVQEQTKRHVFLAKLLGIKQLFVVVNKMDTVNYEKEKFEDICKEARKFFSSVGFDPEKIHFIPISAKEGDNVFKKSDKMLWYTDLTLIDTLDNEVTEPTSPVDKPLRIPVQNVFKMGEEEIIVGKVETGVLRTGDDVLFKPSSITGTVLSIEMFGEKKDKAIPGESIGFRVNCGCSNLKRGEVCSNMKNPASVSKNFEAEVALISDLDINSSEKLLMRCGTAEVECEVNKIIQRVDSSSGVVIEESAKSIKSGEAGSVKFISSLPIVLERFSELPQLGRFILIKENRIVAIGIVTDVNG
jgi:elongation factor 1-alpha